LGPFTTIRFKHADVKDDNAFAMLIYVVAALFQEAATTRTAATGRHTAWPQSGRKRPFIQRSLNV
jgi:hypothetical protein